MGIDALGDLFKFALADEVAWIRPSALADDLIDNKRPCRDGQLLKLFAFGVVGCTIGTGMDKNCTFAALRSFKQT